MRGFSPSNPAEGETRSYRQRRPKRANPHDDSEKRSRPRNFARVAEMDAHLIAAPAP